MSRLSPTPDRGFLAAASPQGAAPPASTGYGAGGPSTRPRLPQLLTFGLGLATGLLVALLLWTLAKGASELRAEARDGIAQGVFRIGSISERPEPRDWRVAQEPYTFEHMFRSGDEPETLDHMYGERAGRL